MASSYPNALDNLDTNKSNSTISKDDHAQHHDDMADAINKIEATLGTALAGVYQDLATRLLNQTKDTTSFSISGSLSSGTGAGRLTFPFNAKILGVIASIGTAPVGNSVIVDVLKNGITLFTTQANRPTIAVGTNASALKVPDVTSVLAGDFITVNIAQVGSSTPGSNLTVTLVFSPA